ncbi:MAG: hypothetical protein M0P71_01465 [Melioribacteraceae bacterium]|nr:hypothetical protein [Melioribacteraceae bacterium]
MIQNFAEDDIQLMEMVRIYKEDPAAAARDLLGIDLAPHQRIALRAMWDCNNVIMVLSRGSGKCIVGDSMCLLNSGFHEIAGLHKSEEFGLKESVIQMYGENGFKNTSHTYKNEPKQIYRTRTCHGYEIKSVDKHMIRCFENGNITWKRNDDIKIGDYVVINRDDKYEFSGEFNWISEIEGYMIGALIGDGCFVKSGGVGFTNTDEDIINIFRENYKKLGACKFSELKDKIEFSLNFGGAYRDKEFFSKYKLKKVKSKEKEIPESILQSNKKVLASFISGYADTDGSVTDRGVEFSSCSEKLLKQLQVVLLSFGIISSIHYKSVKYIYKGIESRRDSWRLFIYSNSAKIFAEKIGFKCNRKQDKLETLLLNKKFNPNKDVIPFLSDILISVKNDYLKNKVEYKLDRKSRTLLQNTHLLEYNPSYRFLNEFLELTKDCSDSENWKKLKDISEKNYFFDIVVEKEILPEEHTYDVHIPDDHTFISNGFISHNTFIDAVFAILRALLFPGEKVGIFGASFRQSKFVFSEIERIYETSLLLRDCCEKKPTKMTDMCYLQFKSVCNKPGSVIQALPIGDGGTIRGARFFTVIVDEVAQVNKEVLDVVIRGMMATSKNPMEQVRFIEEQKKLLALGKINKIEKLYSNKIVLSSTSYYQYNHFWVSVKSYIDSIMEKQDRYIKLFNNNQEIPEDLQGIELRGNESGPQIPYNIMKDNNRALVAFTHNDYPEGFMNRSSIDEAKLNMPDYQFRMEYENYFPADSDGFFQRSLLDKSQLHYSFSCEKSLAKQSGFVNVMGIDPARNGDNFAIAIFTIDIAKRLIKLKRVLAYNKQPYPVMHREIRNLIKEYNITEFAMDSGGGGQTIRDLLADSKTLSVGETPILQRGFEEHRFMKGNRMLELVEFSRYEWVHNANHNLLLSLQNGTLLFPCEKGLLTNCHDEESTEDELMYKQILETMNEIQNIVVTLTPGSGRMHWDTPQKKQRKDRYSAVLIGHDLAYNYLENINKPQSLAGGFWN